MLHFDDDSFDLPFLPPCTSHRYCCAEQYIYIYIYCNILRRISMVSPQRLPAPCCSSWALNAIPLVVLTISAPKVAVAGSLGQKRLGLHARHPLFMHPHRITFRGPTVAFLLQLHFCLMRQCLIFVKSTGPSRWSQRMSKVRSRSRHDHIAKGLNRAGYLVTEGDFNAVHFGLPQWRPRVYCRSSHS